MRILYETMTGNVKRFLSKTGLDHQSIGNVDQVHEPFVLVTNTIGFGDAPEQVKAFLQKNSRYLVAVAASGNRNWGRNFAHAADVIAQLYNVPVLYKFELGGTDQDVAEFRERVKALAERSNQVEIVH
ncbi:class Ib ribonucleoside-diphosphate reductase assembly flavoprotein NrdI [Sporolactobacillus sp. CPB3-1]|uniref:Protein NrdI n=1 Tax=Sporolactobacillus mangiferae TaxID=2940498 RepID=A0ABT0M8D6_9BACL|nr:class Ib ribonucleoside-diphosphate reductase assembly flavoprotein NrdI [Sporolactobacillus mangiferae]MCL1631134.1 class Ib ribonucleoside-diphosphate reductase assembly flavoprotein NrdI [Sporolactobacillus mangiferae]